MDGKDVHSDAHSFQILRSLGGLFLREACAVTVHFLHSQRSENCSQMAFQRLKDYFLDLVGWHTKKTLGRCSERGVVTLDLDVGDRLHRNRHALQRVCAFNFKWNRKYVERKIIHLFEQGKPESRSAVHHTVANRPSVRRFALAAAQDGYSVRRHFQIVAAEKRHGHKQRKHHQDYDDRNKKLCRHFSHPSRTWD